MKRMVKDQGDNAFKYNIYIEHFVIVLNLVKELGPKKTVNIIFSKESRILEGYSIIKDKKRVWVNYI